MAWGYAKGFTIEHDPMVKKRIDCKDCCYYDRSDRSCMKRPLYLPEDGYNSWKNCDYFELDSTTSNYEAKLNQLETLGKVQKQDPPNSLVGKHLDNELQIKELNKIYKLIVDSNRVVIWQKKGQTSRCKCGEVLAFSSRIILNYINNKKLHQLHMEGKWCKKCETYYVVKSLLLDEIKKEVEVPN